MPYLAEGSGDHPCPLALSNRGRPSVARTLRRAGKFQCWSKLPSVCCVASGKLLAFSGPRFIFCRMKRLHSVSISNTIPWLICELAIHEKLSGRQVCWGNPRKTDFFRSRQTQSHEYVNVYCQSPMRRCKGVCSPQGFSVGKILV